LIPPTSTALPPRTLEFDLLDLEMGNTGSRSTDVTSPSPKGIDRPSDGSHQEEAAGRLDQPIASVQQEDAAGRITFLDLPPEVRNQVYEYCILDFELEINSKAKMPAKAYGDTASLQRPEARPNATSFAEYWERMPIDESPASLQSSWSIEPMEIYRKFIVNGAANPEFVVTMVRRTPRGGFRPFEASYVRSSRMRSLVINIFLVNRQICQEASRLFYEKNHFVFNTRWEDAHLAPLAFLWDHPGSYMWMRSLHITMPDPPVFVNNGRMPRGENALPSHGGWKSLITQIRKMRLRHFGLTISVDVTDRFCRSGDPYFPFSAAYTNHWFEVLLAINGLQSMRLLFDVNPQFTNPNIETVTDVWPSDLPAIMGLAQGLKDHWLSKKGSYEDARLVIYNSQTGKGATGQRLEFVSWVMSGNPHTWVFPLSQLPLSLSQQDNSWYQLRDITAQYQSEHFTRPGFDGLTLSDGEQASQVVLRHPQPSG
jgi:hypothetical protein